MLAGRNRKIVLFLTVLLMVLGVAIFRSYSQVSPEWSNVTFTYHSNIIKIFDHTTGKIYSYSELDGKLHAIWMLEKPGQDLKLVYKRK